ncbi:MAG TPA: efflux RND transporter periplasmic adaptor subunit [Alloacidobacterium sp.]|nr:efflux RND transporter periplasmic adaptor subunit [Alloacidobacterium sp.]
MRKRSVMTLAAGLAFPAALGMLACRSKARDSEASAAEIPTAKVATVQRGDISHVLRVAGQFQPYQVIDVHPKVSGYMQRINVDIGDVVHKGQTLAVLEIPELHAELQGSQFSVEQSKEEINRAQHEIQRADAVHAALHSEYVRLQQTSQAQPGLVAQQELDDTQAKDLSSEAQVDTAKAALASVQQHLQVARSDNQRVQALQDYTNVIAPIDGVIIWRYADTGALIQGGTNSNSQDVPIVRLSQSSLLRLRVPVPENDVRYIHVGDAMQVRVDAISRSFTGKIARFTRNVNFETRSMEAEVDVENKDLSIDPGMYANASLQLARVENVLTVPIESLVLKDHQEMAYVLDSNNHVHVRTVEIGTQGSKLAEIKAGLNLGDRVIVGSQEKYVENEEVKPMLTPEPTSDVMQEAGGVIDVKTEESDGGAQ